MYFKIRIHKEIQMISHQNLCSKCNQPGVPRIGPQYDDELRCPRCKITWNPDKILEQTQKIKKIKNQNKKDI